MRSLFIAALAFCLLSFAGTPAIGQLSLLVPAQDEPAAPATATTEPSAASDHAAVEESELGSIDFIKVLRGEKNLTPEQALQFGYWLDFGKDLLFGLLKFIPKLLTAMLLMCIFWLIYRIVRGVLIGGMKTAGVDDSIRDMLSKLLRTCILGFGLVIAGNQIGIQIAALLTGVSIIGLAVGFAAQESLSNFIAGILIFWDKPFKVGDWIEIEGHLGQVKRVTFRSTRLDDLDGDVVVFPNVTMLSSKLINKSANVITRCNVPFGIAYKEGIEAARTAVMDIVNADKRIEKKPEAEVVVHELADSGVNLMLHFWIREEKYEDAMQYEYMEHIKNALDRAGIEIPFPHMQIVLPDKDIASLKAA